MSILQFLRILIARRMIILGTFLTCVVVALGVAALLPARYPAQARVMMDLIKPDPVTGATVATAAMRGYVRTQIELIKDYRVAGDAVDKLGLLNSPDVIAAFQADTGGAGDPRRWMAQRIIDSTSADLLEGSNILIITYEGPSPDQAKRIVNALREAYIENNLRFRTEGAGRTAEWYRQQADSAQRALAAAEAAKSKFEAENGIVMTAGGEAETVKLAGLQSALVQARSAEGAQQFQATQTATSSGVVDQLKIQVANISDQIEQAAEKLGTEHPTYKALLARRSLLQAQLGREQAAARAASSSQLGASRQSIAMLEAQYEAQRARVNGMKGKLDQLAQLQREVDLRREQYSKAAARTAELRLESNVSESGLLVLGDATSDETPSFPKWPQVIALSVGLGLALGVVLGLLVELLGRRVRGAEDLRYAAKVPVFAVIAAARPSPFKQTLRRLLSRRGEANAGWQPAQ